jgi:hypothetical protein
VESFLFVITTPEAIQSPWLERFSNGDYRFTLWGEEDYIRAYFRMMPDRVILYWVEWIHAGPYMTNV